MMPSAVLRNASLTMSVFCNPFVPYSARRLLSTPMTVTPACEIYAMPLREPSMRHAGRPSKTMCCCHHQILRRRLHLLHPQLRLMPKENHASPFGLAWCGMSSSAWRGGQSRRCLYTPSSRRRRLWTRGPSYTGYLGFSDFAYVLQRSSTTCCWISASCGDMCPSSPMWPDGANASSVSALRLPSPSCPSWSRSQ